MTVRKVIFWMHLIAGCTGGVVILLMSITGVLLTYQRQIMARVERGGFRADPPSQGASRLSVEDLLLKASEQTGGLPANATVTLRSDPREPVEIGVLRESPLYLNPYTGQVLGRSSSQSWRTFFQEVTAWHRYLGATGEGRPVAKAVTGACNLAFLWIVASGLYLWIPKKWNRSSLPAIMWFRGGVSGRARDFNWHNVFGFWMGVPLFIVVASAVPISYVWGTNLIYKATGTQAPPRADGNRAVSPRRDPASAAPKPELAGLNQLWDPAERQVAGWRSIAMPLPESPRGPVVFTIDTGDGGQPQKRATLTLDRATGGVLRWEDFPSLNAGRRLRSWTRFLHTGEALGLAGQTVAGIASLAGVMLVWTGISLALRRFAAWARRRGN